MKIVHLIVAAALTIGMPTVALAQPAASPHQHGQPAATAQSMKTQKHQGNHQPGECNCCQMMMQMMEKMMQHGAQAGGMQKMNMMQTPEGPQHGSTPADATEHPQHKGQR